MSSSIDEYLNTVARSVYDSKQRNAICRELKDTIDDFTEMYMEVGLSEEEAKNEAVKQMGNPEQTGQLFNKVYHVKYEWKVAAYMVVCAIMMKGAHYLLNASEHTRIAEKGWWIAFFVLFTFGFALSCVEKWMDLPMFYAWTENWNGGGLRNAAMFIGISMGCLPVALVEYFMFLVIGTLLILMQRKYIETKRFQKEQKYLWKDAEALETFDYKER